MAFFNLPVNGISRRVSKYPYTIKPWKIKVADLLNRIRRNYGVQR